LPGEGDESGGESETDIDILGGEIDTSTILPEDLSRAVQDNNSSAASRSRGYVSKPKDINKMLREEEDALMDIEGLSGFK
jgi:hypothetical protein